MPLELPDILVWPIWLAWFVRELKITLSKTKTKQMKSSNELVEEGRRAVSALQLGANKKGQHLRCIAAALEAGASHADLGTTIEKVVCWERAHEAAICMALAAIQNIRKVSGPMEIWLGHIRSALEDGATHADLDITPDEVFGWHHTSLVETALHAITMFRQGFRTQPLLWSLQAYERHIGPVSQLGVTATEWVLWPDQVVIALKPRRLPIAGRWCEEA